MNNAMIKTSFGTFFFAAFLVVSAGALASVREGPAVFNGGSYPGALTEKELRQIGVSQDLDEAASWLRIGNEPENANDQFFLGLRYERGQSVLQDYRMAALWYRKAAMQGHADAQNSLGWLYENGKGVPHSDSEAVSWYREAAEQGNADAQFNLGVMYFIGRGVPRDLVQAYKWFSLSEELVGADASNNRKLVEAGMTPEQVKDAQEQVRKWLLNRK